MDNGCAGFFSDEDLEQGRGVIKTSQELKIKQNSKGRYFCFRGSKKTKEKHRETISHLIKPYPKRQQPLDIKG